MSYLSWLLLACGLVASAAAVAHALLNKPDPRAAVGWIAVCVLAPLVGPILYYLFGVNRVVTRAQKLASNSRFETEAGRISAMADRVPETEQPPLAQISSNVTGRPLLSGNHVLALYNGEQAYPQMLDAIESAQHSIFMATYIFNTRRLGRAFIAALTAASERGLDVRVILDGIGEFTNIPRASTLLQRAGVRAARFIPPSLLPPAVSINLRNHRKILLIDDQIAFTGGMNISASHLAEADDNPKPVTDIHFKLSGPIISQIRLAFLEDWGFVTDEREPPPLASPPEVKGEAMCRTIIDGPNEYFGQMAAVILGVICAAERRVAIMTPYFLPSQDLIAVLRAAVLRGVQVRVILPGKSDHAFVAWATRRMLSEILSYGIEVYYQPPPFCHSKLLLVDDDYCLIGSANMDPRSLRLNFELGVEVYGRKLAQELWRHFRETQRRSKPVNRELLDQRPTWQKLRDAAAWLCSPYL